MKNDIKYYVSIEKNVNRSLSHFANIIYFILNHKKTWNKYKFIRTYNKYDADFKIILSKPSTIRKICNLNGLSCTNMITKDIYINSNRWINGSKKSKLNLNNYRIYLINHEVFHALGGGHNKCANNSICPVTYQQTLGIPKNSKPNPWPLDSEQKLLHKTSFIWSKSK